MLEDIARATKYMMPHSLRNIINLMAYQPDFCQFQAKHVDYVVMDGYKFYPSSQLLSLVQPRGAWFAGVRPTDTVLDLGAGIGSVAIPLAAKAKTVYTVEPLFHNELLANVKLNELKNVANFVLALSDSFGTTTLSFGEKKATVNTVPFSHLLKLKPNFLKVDIEGYEWFIKPEDLLGIREIRIEFHIRRTSVKRDRENINKYIGILRHHNYKVIVKSGVHEPSLQFKTVDYLIASHQGGKTV